ncbi:MAG: penicillin-binding protein 2, partial [Acidimicrobiales bacterium]
RPRGHHAGAGLMATAGTTRLRLTIVGVVVISLFAALLTRLWYLQVLDAPTFVEAAKRNEVRILCEPAPRGRIRDRTGEVIVDNELTTAVTVSKKTVHDQPQTLPRLSALLGAQAFPVAELQKRLDDPRYSNLKPVPVAFGVPTEKVIFMKENSETFPGVDAVPLASRRYPLGRLASHVVGTVGPITQKELDKAQAQKRPQDGLVDPVDECRGYKDNDEIGKTGVEASFDGQLRGKPGVVALEVDRKNKVLAERRLAEPVQGDDVWLTIDAKLQATAEESVKLGLAQARTKRFTNTDPRFLRAPGGSAVVVDVTDGAVLAMASYPDFAPSDFVGGISTLAFQAYNDNPDKPLTNRAIQGLYPPASTFKLPSSLAGLVKGVIPSPETRYNDTGVYRIPPPCSGKCDFQNAGKTPHGAVNLREALALSSDTYFYDVGARFWIGRNTYGPTAIQDTARQLGLGQRTGIRLASEAEGRVSDPEVRKRLNEKQPKAFPDAKWFIGDNVITAIGQGETVVTPLQLAMEYATFANGGTLYQARIAAQVSTPDDPTGAAAIQLGPITRSTMPLPPEVHDPIAQGLRGAVTSSFGTASGAFAGYSGIPVAGKTGTAQQPGDQQDTAIFASFGPIEAPRYAVSVVLEEAGYGGTTAAPVARRLWEQLSGKPPGELRATDSPD